MERIVIEVEKAAARKWIELSPEMKSELNKKFEELIEDISYETRVARFESLLKKASDEAARNGLTEEILQQLLNEE